jgi:hypothetical protein
VAFQERCQSVYMFGGKLVSSVGHHASWNRRFILLTNRNCWQPQFNWDKYLIARHGGKVWSGEHTESVNIIDIITTLKYYPVRSKVAWQQMITKLLTLAFLKTDDIKVGTVCMSAVFWHLKELTNALSLMVAIVSVHSRGMLLDHGSVCRDLGGSDVVLLL